MSKKENLRVFIWIELAIWLLILSIAVLGIRHYRLKQIKSQTIYQIFMPDVDGLIVGSPIKFMGVQIGYIDKIKIVGNDVYVRLLITDKSVMLPQGVIATTEFSGLGGSKSLELYPPTDDSIASKKLIAIEEPKRLHDAIGLLNQMFDKIDSISQRISFFGTETKSIQPKSNEALDVGKIQYNIDTLDGWVDVLHKKYNDNRKKELKDE